MTLPPRHVANPGGDSARKTRARNSPAWQRNDQPRETKAETACTGCMRIDRGSLRGRPALLSARRAASWRVSRAAAYGCAVILPSHHGGFLGAEFGWTVSPTSSPPPLRQVLGDPRPPARDSLRPAVVSEGGGWSEAGKNALRGKRIGWRRVGDVRCALTRHTRARARSCPCRRPSPDAARLRGRGRAVQCDGDEQIDQIGDAARVSTGPLLDAA
jgi:hypothetical protein